MLLAFPHQGEGGYHRQRCFLVVGFPSEFEGYIRPVFPALMIVKITSSRRSIVVVVAVDVFVWLAVMVGVGVVWLIAGISAQHPGNVASVWRVIPVLHDCSCF